MTKKDKQVFLLFKISTALGLVANRMLNGEELTEEYKKLIRECVDSLNAIAGERKDNDKSK